MFEIRVESVGDNVPKDVFMVMPLVDNALAGVTGVVKYHPAFNGV